MADITKKKQSRSGHHASAAKTLAKAKGLIESISPKVKLELVPVFNLLDDMSLCLQVFLNLSLLQLW